MNDLTGYGEGRPAKSWAGRASAEAGLVGSRRKNWLLRVCERMERRRFGLGKNARKMKSENEDEEKLGILCYF